MFREQVFIKHVGKSYKLSAKNKPFFKPTFMLFLKVHTQVQTQLGNVLSYFCVIYFLFLFWFKEKIQSLNKFVFWEKPVREKVWEKPWDPKKITFEQINLSKVVCLKFPLKYDTSGYHWPSGGINKYQKRHTNR